MHSICGRRRSTKVGVETEMHIWDGMWHAFFIDPDLPESKERSTESS
jgi:hypothetical protein